MSVTMVPGQNRPVSGERVLVDVTALRKGGRYSLAVIPVGVGGTRTDGPFLSALDGIHPFVALGPDGFAEISLDAVAATTEKLLLAVYAVRAAATLRDLRDVSLKVDGTPIGIGTEVEASCAALLAELYRRNGSWKLRILSEGVTRGLQELGRRLGMPLDDSGPQEIGRDAPRRDPSPAPSPSGNGGVRPDWTGSGFVVAPSLIVTNAHVVNEAREIYVASFEGRTRGSVVIKDERNDLALVRVERPFEAPALPFRPGRGPTLGEMALSIGYPLAGILGSGPQVAQGSVSGLMGPGDDVRMIQVSTPVQPGSSGGPVIDAKGRVIGVITAMMRDSQVVNFAVRGSLAQGLVEASGRPPSMSEGGPALDVSEVIDRVQASVLRLECLR